MVSLQGEAGKALRTNGKGHEMDASMQMKRELRAQLKAQRAALAPKERASIDAKIAEQVRALPQWVDAEVVCAYASFADEVDTWGLIESAWASGKTVVLPRVVEGTRLMRWFIVNSRDELVRSAWGIEEPAIREEREVDVQALSRERPTVALVPGLAFDARGYRLGYGGGFYDCFLNGFGGLSLGLVRSAFFFDMLTVLEPHDLAVDAVVSERGIEFSRS